MPVDGRAGAFTADTAQWWRQGAAPTGCPEKEPDTQGAASCDRLQQKSSKGNQQSESRSEGARGGGGVGTGCTGV